MRADAAPFIPSVLLNSSTYECTNEKNDERQQQRSQNRRRQRRWREKHGAVVCGKETKSSKPDESRSSIPSNKQQLVEQHRKRRSRRRRRNQRRNSSNDDDQSSSARPDTTHTDDVVDYNEECFPTLLTSDYTIHHNNKPHADTSWGESLAKKLATSLELKQQQTNHRVQNNNSDEDDDEFGVQLNSDVQLTKLSRSRATNVTLSSGLQEVDIDQILGIEIAQNENVALQFNDDENDNCALVTNVRWKWNDAQLSKMRQRWWNAVREQQTLTDESKKRCKAVKSEHSTDELSDGSSISSDASSLLSIEDDDDHLQPPSLSQPFDENPTPQIADISWSPQVPKAVLELEEACCETDYPVHAIIYLHALQNPFIDDEGHEDTAQTSTKPDSVVVLHRLLALEDHDSVQQWREKRIGLDKLSKFRNPPLWVKNLVNEIEQIASADNEMTPLQLAITLNCPDIIRALVSSTMASYGVHNGCTPLMLACELGRIACIKALLCSSHVKLDYRERRGGNTCYHYCCLNQNNGVAALDTLMSHTTNTTRKRVLLSTNREGRNLLHLACARGDLPLLESLLGHLSNISSQLPWKALTMNDRLGHNPFISAVYANECEIVEHLLLTRFAGADYTSWFSACPLTIASSNLSLDMAKLLFEMGYDTRSTTNPNFFPIIRYDVNRSLLELMLVSIDDDDEVNTDKHELIGLLIEHGANPLSAVNVFTPNKPKTRGDNGIAALSTEEETPLSVAVVARDYLSIECMLHSYTHALTVTQSSRRKDPILISQPESYFRAVEERETDMVHSSLQSALVKALFITWQQNGDHAMGKCCLALYRRGVALSQLSMQWLEKCLLMERLIPPLTIRDDSTEKYYFEAPHVQYSLPNASGCINPVTSADTFLCWSQILLSLPWVVNKFAFNCNWIRNGIDSDFDPGELKNDEMYLVVEGGTRLLVHRSIISARSGKLAAAIRFAEAQEKYNDDEGGTISIIIDLPLLIAKMLICHCYHGSISFGLMASATPLKRCEQLLELALVAEEYLLPSLITEVEMRLLDTKGNHCFCAYCSGASLSPCDAVECSVTRQCLTLAEENLMTTGVYFQKASHSNTISQSSLISPGSSLSVLAVSQQLEQSSSSQSGSYILKYIKCQESVVNSCIDVEKDVNAGTIDTPFLACKAVAVYTLLREFKVFMHLANTESDDIPTLIDIENDSGIDETHILLLRTCLEELAQSPFRRKDFHNGPTNLSSRWMRYKNDSGKA